jgi:hypothetical protein
MVVLREIEERAEEPERARREGDVDGVRSFPFFRGAASGRLDLGGEK